MESRLQSSSTPETFYALDTAKFFIKTVIAGDNFEKKEFTKAEDSLLFFNDLEENELFHLNSIIKSPTPKLSDSTLKKIDLEYDSVSISVNPSHYKATFYSNKKSMLYDINKTYFLTFDTSKIFSKTIKIEQSLLRGDKENFEINYQYKYK